MCGEKPKYRAEQHVVHATIAEHEAWRAFIVRGFVEVGRLRTGHDCEAVEREGEVRLRALEAASFADAEHLPTWYVRNLAKRDPLMLSLTFSCTPREDGNLDSLAVIREF